MNTKEKNDQNGHSLISIFLFLVDLYHVDNNNTYK